MKEMIGYLGANDRNTNLNRGGTIYMYLHDPWDRDESSLSAEEKMRRKWFLFCGAIVKDYREAHSEPEDEDKAEGDSSE